MTLFIAGMIVGGIVGWIAAHAWLNTPTGQVAPPVFLTHKSTGKRYRRDQTIRNAEGIDSFTVILYRLDDRSLEAWSDDRVRTEFEITPEP